jgi:hypothetical protein
MMDMEWIRLPPAFSRRFGQTLILVVFLFCTSEEKIEGIVGGISGTFSCSLSSNFLDTKFPKQGFF